jgi:hypothetical protein
METGLKHFVAQEDFFKRSKDGEYSIRDFANLLSGNLAIKLDLFKLPCGMLPLELTLYYNSLADRNIAYVPSSFGKGWQSIFDQRIEEINANPDIDLYDHTGAVWSFLFVGPMLPYTFPSFPRSCVGMQSLTLLRQYS